MACPTVPPAGICGGTTAWLSPLPPSRIGWGLGGKKAQARMDTDFLDWALTDFSGYVAADELYLTVRANFREKRRIEISSWNERTNHNHPRANRRYSGHPRLSTANACGRSDRQTLSDPWALDGLESRADAQRMVDLHSFGRRPPARTCWARGRGAATKAPSAWGPRGRA